MPDFRKSYKKSKNSKNSKSGGRRRKHTMRKYRRGKKVMRGGAKITSPADLEKIFSSEDQAKYEIFDAFSLDYGLNSFDDLYKQMLNKTGNTNSIDTNELTNRFLQSHPVAKARLTPSSV